MSFITNPAVPNGKVDRVPVPSGEENKFFSAEEWNSGICQALLDLRSHVLNGYFGLVERSAAPSGSGLSSTQLWAKDDGNLIFSRGVTNNLVAAGPVTTKGDLLVFDGANWGRLPRGSNGQALVTDSAQTLGLKWAAGGGGGGSVTEVDTGTGLTGGPITDTGTIALADTAVAPGTYSAANITVDQQGRITAAADGAAGTTIGFVSVAALRAGASGGLVNGQRTLLDGYYARGDGGGGQFYWAAASTTADDGGAVIKPTDVGGGAGRWIRLFDEPRTANVRWWGAKDDTTLAFDSGPAMVAAITYLEALPQIAAHYQQAGRLRIPAGNYRSSLTLNITRQMIVEGDGQYWNTSIYFRNIDAGSGTPIDGIVVALNADDIFGVQFTTIRQLSLYGDGNPYNIGATQAVPYQNDNDPLVGPGSGHAYAAGNGIVLLCRGYVENCSTQGFKYDGIHLDSEDLSHNGNVTRIKDCISNANGRHAWYSKGDNANACVIDNLDGNANAGCGILERGFLGNTYIGGQFAENGLTVCDVSAIKRNTRFSYMGTQPELWAASSVQGGLYLSDDRNGHWRSFDRGNQDVTLSLDQATRLLPIRKICNSFQATFVACVYGIWRVGMNLDAEQLERKSTATVDTWALAHDENDQTMYAGTNGGGVYKSADQGDTWTQVNSGLGNLDVRALATDPATAGVVYAGTHGNKVYKSTNHGTSWTLVATGFSSTNVLSLVMKTGLLYAGCDDGKLYKTTDGGANWTNPLTASGGSAITDIAIDPQDSTRAICSTDGAGAYTTANTGGAWTHRTSGLTHYQTVTAALNLLSCEIDFLGRMYVGSRGDNSVPQFFQTGGIFQSDDSGATFTQFVGTLRHGHGVKTYGSVSMNVFNGTYVESDQTNDIRSGGIVLGGILGENVVGPADGGSPAPTLGASSISGMRFYGQYYAVPMTFTSGSVFATGSAHGGENLIYMDAGANTNQVVLPPVNAILGKLVTIVRLDDTNNDCYVDSPSNIDGDPYLILTDKYEWATLVAGATTWHVIAKGRGGNRGDEYPQVAVADANKTITNRERFVRYTTLTATRTATLPAPSDFNKYRDFLVNDESGNASPAVKIHVVSAGGATIDGVGWKDIARPYDELIFYNNGTSWFTRLGVKQDVTYFITVAALRAASGAYLVDGQRAQVDGYHSFGDGGGGNFVYVAASTATEDGGLVLRPSDVSSGNPGRWLRQCDLGELNVKWYGAIGDGSSHPASGFFGSLGAVQDVYPHATSTSNEMDWLAAEAACLQTQTFYPHSNGSGDNVHGGTVLIPYGVFLFDQPIAPAAGKAFYSLRIASAGPMGFAGSAHLGGTSWIKYTGAAARAFDFRSGDTIEVQDLTIWYDNLSFAGKTLFDCAWMPGINSDSGRIRWFRCAFAGDPSVFGAGEGAKAIISLRQAIACHVEDCAFGQAIAHVRMSEYIPGFQAYSNQHVFRSNTHNYGKWFYVNVGTTIVIDGNAMEGLGGFTQAAVVDDCQRTEAIPAVTFEINAVAQTITLVDAGGRSWADFGFVNGMSPFLHDRNGRTVGPNNLTLNPITIVGNVMTAPGSGLVDQTNTWSRLQAPTVSTGVPGAFCESTLGVELTFHTTTIVRDNGRWDTDNWYVGDSMTIASPLNTSAGPITAISMDGKTLTIASASFVDETTNDATLYEQSASGPLTFTGNWCGDQFLPGSTWFRFNQPPGLTEISGNIFAGSTRVIELNTGGSLIDVSLNSLSSVLSPVFVHPDGPGYSDVKFSYNGVAVPLLDAASQPWLSGYTAIGNGPYAKDQIDVALVRAAYNCLFKIGGDIDPAVSGTFVSYVLQLTQGGKSLALGADTTAAYVQAFGAPLLLNAQDTYAGIGVSLASNVKSTLQIGGAPAIPNLTITDNANINWQRGVIMLDATSHDVTATLIEAASTCPGRIYFFGRTDSSGHVAKVTPVEGGDYTLTDANSRLIIQSDGTNYIKLMWR